MVSLRSGKAVKDTTGSKKAESSQKTKTQPKANISKKRKAEAEAPEAEDKENEARPSTPPSKSKVSAPPLGDSELANMPGYERTPGREGPIEPENFDVEPDIKPFKGPPGKKVRKTAYAYLLIHVPFSMYPDSADIETKVRERKRIHAVLPRE